MAELTDLQKRQIVEALACFGDAVAIMADFRELYGLELSHRQIGSYDPNRTYYEAGDKYRELFDQRRKEFLADVQAIPAANQSFRMKMLQEGIEAARKAKNWNMVASLCKQAAEEVGGVLTNQRDVKIDDNRRQTARDMTPEDRKLAVAELIRQAMEQIGKKGNTPSPAALQ